MSRSTFPGPPRALLSICCDSGSMSIAGEKFGWPWRTSTLLSKHIYSRSLFFFTCFNFALPWICLVLLGAAVIQTSGVIKACWKTEQTSSYNDGWENREVDSF